MDKRRRVESFVERKQKTTIWEFADGAWSAASSKIAGAAAVKRRRAENSLSRRAPASSKPAAHESGGSALLAAQRPAERRVAARSPERESPGVMLRVNALGAWTVDLPRRRDRSQLAAVSLEVPSRGPCALRSCDAWRPTTVVKSARPLGRKRRRAHTSHPHTEPRRIAADTSWVVGLDGLVREVLTSIPLERGPRASRH